MVENVMLACLVVCARGASLAVHEELTVASYNIRTAFAHAARVCFDARLPTSKTLTKYVVGAGGSLGMQSWSARRSRWAVRDGGDGRNHRTWPARRSAVAKTIEIARASVVGTQEGLARQLDDLVSLLGPHWRCVGAGRVGDGSDEDETAHTRRRALSFFFFFSREREKRSISHQPDIETNHQNADLMVLI